MSRSNQAPVIIRKTEIVEDGGHHGGAWKVAYADFMTAMMAFFLLMWILSTADKNHLDGIAQYFTPSDAATQASGGLGVLDGTTIGPKGVLNASNGAASAHGLDDSGHPDAASTDPSLPLGDPTMVKPADQPANKPEPETKAPTTAGNTAASQDPAQIQAAALAIAHAQDDKRFSEVQHEIVQAIQSAPDLQPLMKNVLFKRTPEGLTIEVVDQDGKAMFASGSAEVTGAPRDLIERLGRAIAQLPNDILISGHTDAVPYSGTGDHDNWELSSNRANATRRVFLDAGVDVHRITRISGLAATEPLNAGNPLDPSNRRISVLLAYLPAQSAAAAPAQPTIPVSAAADIAPAIAASKAATAPASDPLHTQQSASELSTAPVANTGVADPATAPAAPAPVTRSAELQRTIVLPKDAQYSPISLDELRNALQ